MTYQIDINNRVLLKLRKNQKKFTDSIGEMFNDVISVGCVGIKKSRGNNENLKNLLVFIVVEKMYTYSLSRKCIHTVLTYVCCSDTIFTNTRFGAAWYQSDTVGNNPQIVGLLMS